MKISSYLIVDTTNSIELERRRGRESGILQWVLVLGLCALLIFAILAFGAVEEWSTFAFEAGAAVLFLVWAGKQIVSGQLKLSKNPLYAPALFFFVLLLAQVGLRTSAYGYVTKYEVLQYVSYGIVLLIATECVREEDARKKFALALIVFGALYAFLRVGSGADLERQVLLGLHSTIPWLNLRKLRQSRPLCRPDGDACAVSLGREYGPSAERGQASLGRLLRRTDGQHDLPFRLTWRNAFFHSRNCRVCHPDARTEKKSSCSTRHGRSVRLGSGFLSFS